MIPAYKLRTIFMGTPDFAVPCLRKLAEYSDVAAVVTQPDKPRGRGQRLVPSPVKSAAQELGLPVFQPPRVKDEQFIAELRRLEPELIVVVAFGQILPSVVLNLPLHGCINVHASLLPAYRGAAPMQRCLMAGEKVTGVTTMYMDEGLDTGDMLLTRAMEIPDDMNLATLHDELSAMGAGLLVETLAALTAGTMIRHPQDGTQSSYAAMIKKDTGHIDWSASARAIHDLVRALDSWPGAYSELSGKVCKIWRTKVADNQPGDERPGAILDIAKGRLMVATGQGTIEILELQAPGKKRMSAADFLRGNQLALPANFV